LIIFLTLHIHDEHDLLLQVIKGDHLIEQHQVHVLEILRVLRLCAAIWLTVAKVIVGKVAYKAAGEDGQVCKAWAVSSWPLPFSVKTKTPPALLPKEYKTKRPRQKNSLLSGTNKAWPFIRGTTLISWV
jgi:hypothetical protein